MTKTSSETKIDFDYKNISGTTQKSYSLTLENDASAAEKPVIDTDPVDTTVTVGEDATLTVLKI
ncbi:MAG: hypothetical protein AAGU75_23025 [Bacillota bacterium]